MDSPEKRYRRFFESATDLEKPFPYQTRLALEEPLRSLVNVPTGLGKTAAVILAWIWRRRFAEETIRRATPRRLVYCLPMRVLVEQTRDNAEQWIRNLVEKEKLDEPPPVHVLMGGEDADEWDIYPEQDAIIIGTQDMLLSRALNRGYGMSRYRWPMHFGLLNNDCLWVFDEVQLMDVGAATSAQLAGFRQKLGVVGDVRCLWMSATLDKDWLDTVDFDPDSLGPPLELQDDDKQLDEVHDRHQAIKPLRKASAKMDDDAEVVAEEIAKAHQPGSLTLGVFNTVDRAVQVFAALKKKASVEPILIHSRFRQLDRQEKIKTLLEKPSDEGTIVISTQVVEAGVDVSAKFLFTELAPWSSLVQRFGRCNRRGEFNRSQDAQVFWFDATDKELEELPSPYEAADVMEARSYLQRVKDASPAALQEVDGKMRMERSHVIRRRDLIDLFDTTPDLAGNDIDVSRFIRSSEELDVQVFWRDVPKESKSFDSEPEYGKAPRREELCSVPVFGKNGFRQFVKKQRGNVCRWDVLERKWIVVSESDVFPGQLFLVRTGAGGYQSDTGWSPSTKKSVDSINPSGEEPESNDGEQQFGSSWQSIAQHTDEVVTQIKILIDQVPVDDKSRQQLLTAARWHDWGKVHDIFQNTVFDGRQRADETLEPERPAEWHGRRDIAKAPDKKSPVNFWGRYGRKHFRHELASALAMLAMKMDDLAVYLAAAHHGKVRLSIRSLPGEKAPIKDAARLYARGIWDGDELPEVDLGGGVTAPPVRLTLQYMQLGRSREGEPSWAERMLRLRDDPTLGPFRLAYLETLLRAADMRASRLAARCAVEQREATQ